MPKPSDISALVNALSSNLEAHIDSLVAARLKELFTRIDFRAPSEKAPAPRKPSVTRRAKRTKAPVAALPPAAPAKKAAPAPAKVAAKPVAAKSVAARQKSASELRSECRAPGCPTPNSGPRYDFFCREHFKLPAGERHKLKARWAASHAHP